MKKFLLASLATTALFAQPALAQNATTTPVGVMTIDFPATTATTVSTFSIPLRFSPVFTGKPSAVATDTITVAGVNWTANQFVSPTPHYVQIQSGQQAGRALRVVGNTANTLTLDVTDNSVQTTSLDQVGFAFSASDSFTLHPGNTLASVFGSNVGELILTGDTSATRADTVGIWNPITLRQDAYYFHTGVGTWVRFGGSTSVNENNKFLPITEAVVIARRPNRAAAQAIILGEVPRVPTLAKNAGTGRVIYTSTMTPAGVTFSQLVQGTNWKKSDSATQADAIAVYNPGLLKWDTYYQRATDSQWRKFPGATDQGAVVVQPAQTLKIVRRDAVSGANSFTPMSLGYNLGN